MAVELSKDSTPYFRLITDGKNPRGIPGAKFIDDIETFLKDEVSLT